VVATGRQYLKAVGVGHDLILDPGAGEQQIDYHVRALACQSDAGQALYIILLKHLYRFVTACSKPVDHIFRFAVVRYRDSEIQVSGESGYCPDGDG
jgi:hypothetical protein